MKHNQLFTNFSLILMCLIIIVNCSKNSVKPEEKPLNENIVLVKDCCDDDKYGSNYIMADWRDNFLLANVPIRKFDLSNNWAVIKDSVYSIEYSGHFTEANASGTRLLIVRSNYRDVSAGALYEFDLITGDLQLLRDSTLHVSSAVYWHGDETKIVYYRYGNPVGTGAGYYLYDKASQGDSLLLEYISPGGPSDMLNGFDLHPNNTNLLIPAIQATSLVGAPPKLFIYDLATQTKDTLDVTFNYSFVRIGLWLRYNSNGTQILYCNYPRGIYGDTTNDDSEVGIIHLPSLEKQILDVNTNPYGRSIQFALNWSPDDRHIVYGSGRLSVEGAKGRFSLYILKNIN